MNTLASPLRPALTAGPLALLLVVAALHGCGTDDGPELAQGAAPPTPPSLADAAPADGSEPPDAGPDVAPDAEPEDVSPDGGDAPDVQPDPDVPPGGLDDGALCTGHGQCRSGVCWWRADGRRCAPRCDDAACPGGLTCVDVAADARACADPAAFRCAPCDADADCRRADLTGLPEALDRARCLSVGPSAGSRCAVPCSDANACGSGEQCSGGYCVVTDAASCLCSELAASVDATSSCARANDAGVCPGQVRCEIGGAAPMGCDAPVPAVERCNGVDDDCDGTDDERPLDPACGPYACGGTGGCLTACGSDADCASGYRCEGAVNGGGGTCVADGSDGSACDGAAGCDSGYCSNGFCCQGVVAADEDTLCCAEDADCAGLSDEGQCRTRATSGCGGVRRVGRCEESRCRAVEVDDPSVCEGAVCGESVCVAGPAFVEPPVCMADGRCEAPAADACLDGDPCTTDGCGPQGCNFSPRSGSTTIDCYSHDPVTRGVGACRDGTRVCQTGILEGCVGDVGPVAEVCNGLDDDCDWNVDEGQDDGCYPYRCGGELGCLDSCASDVDCGPGTFCDAGGACVSTGADGADCERGSQCESGYCEGGVCCAGRTCCRTDASCQELAALTCEDATRDGCLGFKVTPVCTEAFTCGTTLAPAPEACAGQPCSAEAACLVTGFLVRGFQCKGSGACEPSELVDCSPYRCDGGACPTRCDGDEDCMIGSACRGGACAPLVDGSACTDGSACASGYCSQGVCCGAGLCCTGDDACGALDETPVCLEASSCTGSAVVGVCGEDFQCATATVASPQACAGQACEDPSCVNLAGGGAFREGLNRPVCSAAGTCEDAIRDCREFINGAYCDRSGRTIYSGCDNCSPDRLTCVGGGFNCRCE